MPVPGYEPPATERNGWFVVLEGVSGSGKSTLSRILAEQFDAEVVHTIPPKHTKIQDYINSETQPFAQLAFYLSGALHASDLVRDGLRHGNVIGDRYFLSVVANHCGVHELDVSNVLDLTASWQDYLVEPDLTIYLITSPEEILNRISQKSDVSQSDVQLVRDLEMMSRVQGLYKLVSADDTSAAFVHTDGKNVNEVAEEIKDLIKKLSR